MICAGWPAISGRYRRNNGQSPPRQTTHFRTQVAEKGPYFLRHFDEATGPTMGFLTRGEIEPPLSAIRVRKEAPLIGAGRSVISGGSWRNHGQSPPRQTTLFSDHNQGDGSHISGAGSTPPPGCIKRGQSEETLSAIRVRIGGLLTRRRLAAISWMDDGQSPPIQTALFRARSPIRNPVFLAPPPRRR